jgi:hypothetical protein
MNTAISARGPAIHGIQPSVPATALRAGPFGYSRANEDALSYFAFATLSFPALAPAMSP